VDFCQWEIINILILSFDLELFDFRVQRALHPRTVKIASVGYKPVGVLIFTVQRACILAL
jgi:hypothetical protein